MSDHRTADAAEYRRLYKSGAWRRGRVIFLRQHPLCERCAAQNRTTEASVVNHRKPHKGDLVLFFSVENWQSLCAACHNGPVQQTERIGFSREIGVDGFPIDPNHPANR